MVSPCVLIQRPKRQACRPSRDSNVTRAPQASRELGVSIRWGGTWINMADIKTGTPGAMKAAVDAYGAARRKLGKAAFTDGPHFELAR